MTICAITTVRNDPVFLRKWIEHYGQAFGRSNLFVILDGHDQPVPTDVDGVNFIQKPHRPEPRLKADRRRARFMSRHARKLFAQYKVVVATDVDEFLTLDPNAGMPLSDYLSNIDRSVTSALGLDVGQHMTTEASIDFDRPFLHQRKFASISSRYTKACIITEPLTWGSGMHRVKGRNFRIDPNLYLFHFGMVDFGLSEKKQKDKELVASCWQPHLKRRAKLFQRITNARSVSDERAFGKARLISSLFRPLYAPNKPGAVLDNLVVRIPDRFRNIV